MSSIVLVSGCPGSGKTTLSRALARAVPHGLHIPSDLFYGFPVRPVDPTRREAHAQNTAVIRALARSARAFAEAGYDVVLDGVIGPWFLPVLREELAGGPPVSCVILHVPEAEALRRVRGREGPGASASVRHMVAAFERAEELADHRVDTTRCAPDALCARLLTQLGAGRLRLAW